MRRESRLGVQLQRRLHESRGSGRAEHELCAARVGCRAGRARATRGGGLAQEGLHRRTRAGHLRAEAAGAGRNPACVFRVQVGRGSLKSTLAVERQPHMRRHHSGLIHFARPPVVARGRPGVTSTLGKYVELLVVRCLRTLPRHSVFFFEKVQKFTNPRFRVLNEPLAYLAMKVGAGRLY